MKKFLKEVFKSQYQREKERDHRIRDQYGEDFYYSIYLPVQLGRDIKEIKELKYVKWEKAKFDEENE